MNGIPLRIKRDGQTETVYLSTIRSGEIGKKIRELKGQYRAFQRKLTTAQKQIGLATLAVGKGDLPMDKLIEISTEQDQAIADRDRLAESVLACCEAIAAETLAPNYGIESFRILDALTDAQIRAIPQILESGDVPADFFPSPDTPASASGTLPNNGISPVSGSKPADSATTP